MDYGQNTPNMMGQGNNGRENNLDLSNQAIDWNLPMPSHDPRSIGNKTAIASAESLNPNSEVPRPIEVTDSPELNEKTIDSIASSIGNPPSEPQVAPSAQPQNITVETATNSIRQAESALDQDINSFYNTFCDTRDAVTKGNS